MSITFSRRRVITLAAAAAGLPLVLSGARAEARLVRWKGTALGATTRIALYHTEESVARAAIAAGVTELAKLERVFSLYQPDSALSTLNRQGQLDGAPVELIELVTHARWVAELSGGAFDPTVQPLWQLYFSHFTAAAPDPAGPAPADLAAAKARVDWRAIEIDAAARRIRLTRPGAGLTLNGIAQGYISDRVAAVLRAHEFERMLVDMGEPLALSSHPDGSAWRIGIADPRNPERTVKVLEVVDKAVATSGGYGTWFDADGRFTHLIDPASGHTAPARASVTVVAGSAARADALSTALAVAPVARRQAILDAAGNVTALFVAPTGDITTLSG
ncbi:MAG: FAD:protein FMN transferase [Azospirillum sp.]|nr:FAD:protein FMN transferase [Azospirillum sp.]